MKTNRLFRISLFSLILAKACLNLDAATHSGSITGNETWSGTVFLTGDVRILPGGNLTILPGTRVECDAGADDQIGGANGSRIEIIVDDGILNATGTEESPILFTSSPLPPNIAGPRDWYGVRVLGAGVCSLHYCTIEYGIVGLEIAGGPIIAENCVFQKNTTGVDCSTQGSSTYSHWIARNNAQNGVIMEPGCGLILQHAEFSSNGWDGIVNYGQSALELADSTISGNTLYGVQGSGGPFTITGCKISDNGQRGIEGGTPLKVSRTEINANGTGGISVGSPGEIADCVIKYNVGWGCDVGALSMTNTIVTGNGGGVTTGDAVSIKGNTISGNGSVGLSVNNSPAAGPQIISGNLITANSIGIGIARPSAILSGIEGNLIFANSTYDFQNLAGSSVVADNNYWGEPTSTELSENERNLSKIYDSRDNSSLGQVVIRAWNHNPGVPTIAPTIVIGPQTQTVFSGNTVTLQVIASGSSPLVYHWMKGTTPLDNIGPAITLSNVTSDSAGDYSVRVTNGAGEAVSDVAKLTVNPASEIPSLSLQTFAGIRIVGEVGRSYSIQYAVNTDSTANWFNWVSITNITLPSTPYIYLDPGSGNRSKGFYRAVLIP